MSLTPQHDINLVGPMLIPVSNESPGVHYSLAAFK
jgi:hypothetical protein